MYPGCSDQPDLGPLCGFHRPAWRQLAACSGADLNRWYSRAPDAVAEARDCCEFCPVARPCLIDALAAEDGLPAYLRFGIRAGLDPAQRVAAAHRSTQTRPAVNRR